MKRLKHLLLAAAALLALGTSFLPQQAAATSFTDFLENKLVDHLFRGTSYTAPASIYVSLHTAACSDSSTGTEVSGGAYARAAVSTGSTVWANTQNSGTGVSTGTNGTTSNVGVITFAAPTANWGSVTHFGVFDALTTGNMMICQSLGTAKTVNNGDAAPSFGAGALTIQVDN